MIVSGIQKLSKGESLSQSEIRQIFTQIMQGEATPAQIAAFITALHIKGETIEEITAAALTMRGFAQPIKVNARIILDTCGTGGSGLQTFNVSTLVALIAAAAGITVAKHGNRSATSKAGSADLLEKLGVNINAEPQTVEKCINQIGIGFLFAPKFHLAMKHAIGPRREIGIRTIFNILGPLTNPARATHQLMGVCSGDLTAAICAVLANLGLVHALVVHSEQGMDEISTASKTLIYELKNKQIKNYSISAEDFGIKQGKLADLQISNVEQSQAITIDILKGKTGPVYDLVVLNAGFALYTADAVNDPKQGIELAKAVLADGRVLEKLELLKKYSNEINT
ncbi:MAG: anthranilate phosphoribosyltransferase [Candidatus Omnitrophica bacterium]|nr:anthranilate phosphoribosyltransferase [Candidatus Omnitrophota bacterium]